MELLRALQVWMGQLSTVEVFAVGGVVSIILWCGIVLPLAYQLFSVPLGLPSFWQRMRHAPGTAVALLVMLLVIGGATIYMALVSLLFLLLVVMFKLIFRWILAAQ